MDEQVDDSLMDKEAERQKWAERDFHLVVYPANACNSCYMTSSKPGAITFHFQGMPKVFEPKVKPGVRVAVVGIG